MDTLKKAGITVFERGWLSSNNILIRGPGGPSALIDSGYVSHAEQTLQLVFDALEGERLDLLLNTHLHSDHCGGNAALQSAYPRLATWIPPGLAPAVRTWDPAALTYEATGQSCARFVFDGLLLPGTRLQLGPHLWEVHAAAGHDPHAVVLFQPDLRILISADALWENGFGVVFPELEGAEAFSEVAATLDLIEQLAPLTIIPGHGGVFHDLHEALTRARSRLNSFVISPEKHRRYALKVLLKFKLLEWQTVDITTLDHWCRQTPYLARLASESHSTDTPVGSVTTFLDPLLEELERNGALRREGEYIFNR